MHRVTHYTPQQILRRFGISVINPKHAEQLLSEVVSYSFMVVLGDLSLVFHRDIGHLNFFYINIKVHYITYIIVVV